MKILLIAAAASLSILAGCASGPSLPAGMKAGQFVDYACEGGKRFSARAAADGSTIRLRFEGGWELDRKAEGVYEADGWKLAFAGGMAEVVHNGKTMAKGCKLA